VEIEPDDDDVMHDASEYQPVREPGEEPEDTEEALEVATQEFRNVPANGNGKVNFRAFWSSVKALGFSEDEAHQLAGVDSFAGYSQQHLNGVLRELAAVKKNEMVAGG
jgi:hypothetical protein